MDVAERLKKGREAAKGDFITWHCRNGREIQAPRDALGVWCLSETCDHGKRTNAAMPKDQYPNWAKYRT